MDLNNLSYLDDLEIEARMIKAREELIELAPAMIKLSEDFFKNNPQLNDDSLCVKLKDKNNG